MRGTGRGVLGRLGFGTFEPNILIACFFLYPNLRGEICVGEEKERDGEEKRAAMRESDCACNNIIC